MAPGARPGPAVHPGRRGESVRRSGGWFQVQSDKRQYVVRAVVAVVIIRYPASKGGMVW